MRVKLLIMLIVLGVAYGYSQQSFALNSSTNFVDVNDQAISFEQFVYLTNTYAHKLTPMFSEDGQMYKVELDLFENNGAVFVMPSNSSSSKELATIVNFKEQQEAFELNSSAYTNVKELAGLPAPNFRVINANNESVELYDLDNKVVVINFWFSKCAPCIEEMPDLNRLKEKYQGDRVVFLAMTVEDYKYTEKFLSKNSFKFNVIPEAHRVAATYKTVGYPTTVVIDVNKRVDKVYTGSMTNVFDVLDREVKKCLLQNNDDASVELMDRGESLVFANTSVYTEDGKKLKEDEFYSILMNYQCDIYKHITINKTIYYTIIKNQKK